MKFKIKNRLKQKGQAAIFILMMFSLIFMLFGMGINVAMLVHHKINLQNAADMAALAGASEQARILNMIGWKNYELRKNFKQFVYRYWVQFNDRHPNFPDPGIRLPTRPRGSMRVGSAIRRWGDGNLPRMLYKAAGTWTNIPTDSGLPSIPSYCFGDDFGRTPLQTINCEITPQDKITAVVAGPSDWALAMSKIEPTTAILVEQSAAEARERSKRNERFYNEYSKTNETAAHLDAYEFSRRSVEIYDTYLNPAKSNSLVSILNTRRTGEVGRFADRPPAWDNFANKKIGIGPGAKGSISHYASRLSEMPHNYHQIARNTVANNLNAEQRRWFEVIPLTPEHEQFIEINPIRLNFTIFWTAFPSVKGYVSPERLRPILVEDFYVGIEKKRSQKTFYALMLRSYPELPFLPNAVPWELRAIAAAQPFGSRIGPKKNEDDYLLSLPHSVVQYVQTKAKQSIHPYIPHIYVDDDRSIDNAQLLYDLKASLWNKESSADPYQLAPFLSPNAWESGRYIFPDPATSSAPIHWTDAPTTENTGSYPAAQSLKTSWGPDGAPRSGYSMKLIPIESVRHLIDPRFQDWIKGVKH